MAKRHNMGVELDAPAKQKLDILSDHHGMTEIATMSRLTDFFAAQTDQLQVAMLANSSGKERARIAKRILKAIARRE